jgi:hypothetical protein
MAVVFEIPGYELNSGNAALFDFNEVVDKPRRAGPSIAC